MNKNTTEAGGRLDGGECNLVTDARCSHEESRRYFSRLVYATKVGPGRYHIKQRCLACGRVVPGWVGHGRFADPDDLPLDGDSAGEPNAHLLRSATPRRSP